MVPGPSRILVAMDGSEYSTEAAKYAINLAMKTDAEIIAVNIIDISSIFRMLPNSTKKELTDIGKREARQMFEDVTEIAKKRDIEIKTEVIETSDSAADVIVKYAEDKEVDLIVLGTKGRSGMKKALLGSVASKVVTYADCPVLVVR